MQRPALPGWPARLLHVGLVALGWLIFSWSWWKVLFAQPVAAFNLSLLIVGAVVVVPAITLAWVVHNRGIYARKGARQANATLAPAYARDWTGSTVHADFEQLRTAPRIVIERSPAGKHFRGRAAENPA